MKAKEKIGPVPFVLIAAAVALIVAGTPRGEAPLVLNKAGHISMEGIGIGERLEKAKRRGPGLSLPLSDLGISEKIWTGNQIRKFCLLPVGDRSSSGRERRRIASFHSHKL